jgi:hypothetical protein
MLNQKQKVSMLVPVFEGVLALSCVFPLGWLTYHYGKICPLEPDEHAGAVYALNLHGTVVYITSAQQHMMLAGQVYLIGSLLCFVALVIWTERKPRSKKANGPDMQIGT